MACMPLGGDGKSTARLWQASLLAARPQQAVRNALSVVRTRQLWLTLIIGQRGTHPVLERGLSVIVACVWFICPPKTNSKAVAGKQCGKLIARVHVHCFVVGVVFSVSSFFLVLVLFFLTNKLRAAGIF